ncbi:MAG TPA: methylmalonyl-CoA mutase family protein [Bacteriovoracaceae bacterium]|nr:methylmalonyl-CoA mutase family protein [Bacteriovoracaceae bacterium]
MSVLSTFSGQKFNTQREQWENILKAELKLGELGTKGSKSSIDGGKCPTLSLTAPATIQLSPIQDWKKASQTYGTVDPSTIEKELVDDLTHGVRNFFFHKEFLTEGSWAGIVKLFAGFEFASDLEVFLLGETAFNSGKTTFKTIDELSMVTGRLAQDTGGTHFLELALLTCNLIEGITTASSPVYLGVFTDSQFFRNIAKVRAAKLLALKVLEEYKIKPEVYVVALTSYREWTLYERYSNILRNDSAVASAYIAGADHVQSVGYNMLFELGGMASDEHDERSKRMGRNTSHILALESLLGVVQDPAFGSYHLESMTQNYASEAWKEMQKLLPLSATERLSHVEFEGHKTRDERLRLLKTRKHVMAGINDFPDAEESLHLPEAPTSKMFRLAKDFETLRIKTEWLPSKDEVFIGLFGDYAALNARLNFVKNYFQLLGLKVHEVTDENELQQVKGIVVLCAQDDHYPKLMDLKFQGKLKFIAGKFEMPGFTNLYAGQDVYQVLETILNSWGVK